MKKILGEISRALMENPDKKAIVDYIDMKQHEGWKTHQQMLLMMRGMIADTMLSSRFTKLDEREKDVAQRTYHNVNEVIGFLLNPQERANQKGMLIKNFERVMHHMGATNRTQP